MVAEATTRVLGRLMLEAGAISGAELEAALAEQRGTRERLGHLLVRRGVDPEQVARALALQLRLPYAGPPLSPEPSALHLVDRGLAVRLRVVPLAAGERVLRVAMSDPLDAAAVDDLQFQTGRRVEPVVATSAAVDAALAAAFGADALGSPADGPWPGRRRGNGGAGAAEPEEVGALRRASEAPTTIALVDEVLARAIAARASDVHVEPARGSLRVRVRVDGELRELAAPPDDVASAFVSRLKIMAGLDISIKRRPQDGRGAICVDGRERWLRVSTLPADGGEKVVLRILDSSETGRTLEDVGLDADVRDRFRRLLGRGHGVILVTGPTGSGKTTTLYAALAAQDRERRNIITLEDPIEYRLGGVTQVQVHPRAGLTFASGLRAILRQDPDVVMIGEMRDRETVEVGMAAALTGHLVLSTLHTNDAAGAVARLAEMGAAPYLVAGGLVGILAQRLARRLCPHCRSPATAEPATLEELGLPARAARVHDAGGCHRCDGSGYRGRAGIFELLVVDARMRDLILRRAPADALRDAARDAGMRTLGQDAWEKVRAGTTSLAEVRPLLTLLADEAPACRECGTGLRTAFVACPGCGRTLRRRCGCGAALEDGWTCCPSCGRPRVLPNAAASSPAAAPVTGTSAAQAAL